MTTDWPDDNPSAHRALAIFNQTVPLGVASNLIDTRTITIPNGTSDTFGPFPVGQVSHEFAISFGATSGSIATLKAKFTWSDIATGIVTDTDEFGIRAGTVAAPHVLRIFGRSKGNQCTLTLDNAGTGFTADITYVWVQQSRIYEREVFRTLTWGQNAGDNHPNFNMPENVIAQSLLTVAAGQEVTRNLPAWTGMVSLAAATTSGTSDCEMIVVDQGPLGETVYDDFTNSKGRINAQFPLPRSQCQLQVINGSASSRGITVAMIIAPPE